MTNLTFSAAAMIAVTAFLASASANADYAGGGPLVNGGQCWNYSKGMFRDGRFGSWGACPQTASAVRITTSRARNSRQPAATGQASTPPASRALPDSPASYSGN